MDYKKKFLILVGIVTFIASIFSVKYIENKNRRKQNPFKYTEQRFGEFFFAEIKLERILLPVNVVKAEIKFEPEILEARNVSTENSLTTLFIQKKIDNKIGTVEIIGVVPNPGFSERVGNLASIEFFPKQRGITEISLMPSSQVLANNGQGMDITGKLSSKSYIIK